MASPSSMVRPSVAITSARIGLCASRRASRTPSPAASTASGMAMIAGISLDITLNAANMPRASSASTSQREGRQSRRQGADGFDELGEFGIGGRFVSHEPEPELIVLDFQQA